jgi:hypothetical protein
MTTKPKTTRAAPKSGRKPRKPVVTDLMIAQELSGDPKPLSFKRYPGDFMNVILSNGKKMTYGPADVQAAIKVFA